MPCALYLLTEKNVVWYTYQQNCNSGIWLSESKHDYLYHNGSRKHFPAHFVLLSTFNETQQTT